MNLSKINRQSKNATKTQSKMTHTTNSFPITKYYNDYNTRLALSLAKDSGSEL